MIVEFSVPGEPGSKGRPRFNRASGRAYTPAKTVSYEGMLRQAAALAMSGALPIEQPVTVEIVAYFGIPKSMKKADRALADEEVLPVVKKPDLDNTLKACMDPMNGIVYRDDSQVFQLTASKFYSPRPRLTVRVSTIDEAA